MKRTSSLQFKVLMLVAGPMAFLLGVSVFALTQVYGSIEDLDRVSREDFYSQQLILQSQVAFRRQVEAWDGLLLRGRNGMDLDQAWESFLRHEKEAAALAREARVGTPHEAVRSALDGFEKAHKSAGAQYRKALEAYKDAKLDPAAGDGVAQGADMMPMAALEQAAAKADDIGKASIVRAVKSGDWVFRIATGALVATMLLALLAVYFFMRRAVLEPLRSAARFAERIAGGDLTAEIRSNSRDEAGQLLESLGRMNAELSQVVSQVRNSAEAVVTASGQVSAGTTDLSQRTEEQASSLEETAASMEELASTVRQNAENAQQADELARNASKRAEQGGQEVVNVVLTMGDIAASAKRIADIISVIDGIAFQTNILALNAAVEAARAGEQGRGFAVVASEVRSLAQRSAQAAKEIKDLIGASVGKVEAGTRLVEQAGDTIQALVIDVKRVSGLMESIAEASAEQSRGVQQVNRTVTEMDRVVQQNAAAVQQSASAAEGMRRQADALVHAVSTFQLTIEERIEAGARARALSDVAAAAAPAQPQPQPRSQPRTEQHPQPQLQPRTAALTAARAKTARPAVAAGGDDWEEF